MVELGATASESVDVALSPGGRVVGVVTTARDGRPLPDANVSLFDGSGELAAATVTTDDGQYAFPNVMAGEYTVVAEGFAPVDEPVTVADEQVSFVSLQFVPGAAQVDGVASGNR